MVASAQQSSAQRKDEYTAFPGKNNDEISIIENNSAYILHYCGSGSGPLRLRSVRCVAERAESEDTIIQTKDITKKTGML